MSSKLAAVASLALLTLDSINAQRAARPPPPPCNGIVAPPRSFGNFGGGGGPGAPPPPPPVAYAVIGVLRDAATGLETVLTDDTGKECTLTLPCNMDGLAAISAVCPDAVPPAMVPSSCPAACSEVVDPWYTECDAMSPADLVALGAQLNGELIYFAQTCDPRLQPPVIPPAPPPAPNGVVGGESGRQCTDGQDNDGDGIMDCDDPDCDGEFMCSGAADAFNGVACHGVVAPPRPGVETAMRDARGQVCTLTLPCTAEGLAAIMTGACPAVSPMAASQVPGSCPADCSELIDPWYTECAVTAADDILALDTSMNNQLIPFADLCDPRLQAPTYVPPPPPPPPPTTESGRSCTDGVDNDLDGIMDCDDPDCIDDRRCARCQGILAPPRQYNNQGGAQPSYAALGVLLDPVTRADYAMTDQSGAACTLTLPCNADGLSAIMAICPPAGTNGMPGSCPAACSEIIDPWYTECDAMSPTDVAALDTQMNGQFVLFAEMCDPRLLPPVIPAPPPNGVVGGESGRGQCDDQIDNDGDGIMDCDDPDCYDDRACSSYGAPCQGVTPPRRARGNARPPNAVIGVLTDPATGMESALRNDHGKACTLTLPCSVEGLAAISDICPPAIAPAMAPASCPAACAEMIKPWYDECLALSADSVAAIDTAMTGEFTPFVLSCNPDGWGH